MKRTKADYPLELDPHACYKTEHIHNKSKENFESTEKWLYLGADLKNNSFAKIGLTMADLTTRSSSSGNPNYYIFCAFKCENNITKLQLENIERSALKYLDSVFTNPDGSTKRALHAESGRISECFYDINFIRFFNIFHCYLYENHRTNFILVGFENDAGIIEGEFLDCEFNKRISLDEINKNIRTILQH